MNLTVKHNTDTDLLGRALAQQLDLASHDIGHNTNERLRVARLKALACRPQPLRLLNFRTALQTNASGRMDADEGLSLWRILVSALPLIGLVMGLILVQAVQQELAESDVASIDSALLLDDLPPDAYTDPGFLQFLKVQLVQPTRHD